MYYVQDAHSFWDWMYFVALIVVSNSLLVTVKTKKIGSCTDRQTHATIRQQRIWLL